MIEKLSDLERFRANPGFASRDGGGYRDVLRATRRWPDADRPVHHDSPVRQHLAADRFPVPAAAATVANRAGTADRRVVVEAPNTRSAVLPVRVETSERKPKFVGFSRRPAIDPKVDQVFVGVERGHCVRAVREPLMRSRGASGARRQTQAEDCNQDRSHLQNQPNVPPVSPELALSDRGQDKRSGLTRSARSMSRRT